MTYTCHASGPGWVRGVLIFKDGLAVVGATLVDTFGIPVNTQCAPFNWYPSGAIRHAVVIARVTKAGPYTVTFDPPPMALPVMPTPVWPKASVTFTDGGAAYSAFLPDFTDTNPWTTGPLAIERSVVVVPKTTSGAAHPLAQVVFDVCSYNDGSTRIVEGLTNSRDTITATRINMTALTFSVGGATIYGPETHTLYEGQYGIQFGFAGGHLAARLHQDTQMWRDAQAFPDVMPIVESPNYVPTYVMGGFYDMTQSVPMQNGGGRPELGPIFTKAQAEYTIHQTDTIYDQILAQANSAGSWDGYLLGPDGQTLTIDPDHGNKSNAGYGQFNMLEGAHLLDLTTVAFVLTADPCYLRLTQSWGEEIMEGVWSGPANPTSYSGAVAPGSFLDYDYSKHVDGNVCFLGASGFAEPRFIGRTLRTITNAAIFTPKANATLKKDLTTVVNQNIARLDVSYARRPPFGPFNPPGPEFDPGKGLGNSYGAVHPLYASISFWQWFEVAMALYHAYRNGFTTDLGMLKRICGSFLSLWEKVPQEKWRYLDGIYYARFGRKVPDGPLTPIATVDEFLAANWGASPPPGMPAWDGDDNNGNPGQPYYWLEYYTLLSMARWLGLKSPVLDAAIAYMRERAMGQAASRAHYAFLIGDDTIVVTNPPIPTPDPPAPPTTMKQIEISLTTTQKETNADPSTLTFRQVLPVTAAPVTPLPPVEPALKPQTRSSAVFKAEPVAGATVPLDVIAWNAGAGVATDVVTDADIKGVTVLSADSPDFDAATGEWKVGTLARDQRKDLILTVKVND